MTTEERKKLNDKFGFNEANERVERLSGYIASKGKKYKSHYATILNWARKDGQENGDDIDRAAERFRQRHPELYGDNKK